MWDTRDNAPELEELLKTEINMTKIGRKITLIRA